MPRLSTLRLQSSFLNAGPSSRDTSLTLSMNVDQYLPLRGKNALFSQYSSPLFRFANSIELRKNQQLSQMTNIMWVDRSFKKWIKKGLIRGSPFSRVPFLPRLFKETTLLIPFSPPSVHLAPEWAARSNTLQRGSYLSLLL